MHSETMRFESTDQAPPIADYLVTNEYVDDDPVADETSGSALVLKQSIFSDHSPRGERQVEQRAKVQFIKYVPSHPI